MTWQQRVKELLANDQVKKALELFAAQARVQADGQMQNTLILLQSQANGATNKMNLGLLTESQYNLQMNRVKNSALQIIGEFPETAADEIGDFPPAAPPPATAKPGDGPGKKHVGKPESPKGVEHKMLFLAANPTNSGRLQLEKEFAKISTGQQDGPFKASIFSEFATTRNKLLKNLLDHTPKFIHFACHGTDGDDFYLEGILLENDRKDTYLLPAETLADLVKIVNDHSRISLVLLNACETDNHAKMIAERGIPAIGMRGKLPDEEAVDFASVFYITLSRTESIKTAFDVATVMVQANRQGQEPIPVFFEAK